MKEIEPPDRGHEVPRVKLARIFVYVKIFFTFSGALEFRRSHSKINGSESKGMAVRSFVGYNG
jgi:hypothetical protein